MVLSGFATKVPVVFMASIRRGLPLALLLPLLVAGPVVGQPKGAHEKAKKTARSAAESWLAKVDDEDFEENWEAGAELFRTHTDRAAWLKAADAASDTRGSLSSRSLVMTQFRRSVDGATGAGPFVLLKYRSVFEAGSYQEMVLTVKEDDTWRVAGYQVTPLQGERRSSSGEGGP